MPAKAKEPEAPPVVEGDRVAMVSLRADGTPDQVDHVVIGGAECVADVQSRTATLTATS